MAFTVVAPKTQVAEAAELLLDAALNMRLPAWEVADALPAVQAALAAKLADPTVVRFRTPVDPLSQSAAYDPNWRQ